MFSTYFKLGFEHILDLQGYDHILFVLTLCGVYLLKDWKKVLILVTAFTVGHSITLALSAMDVVQIPAKLIEILIPATIIVTAVYNLRGQHRHESVRSIYWLPLLFGLIHGMGFSYFFKALLMEGESILQPLLPFNLGVEAGQIVVVILGVGLASFVVQTLKVNEKYWNYFISFSAIIISSYLMLDRF